MTYLDGKASCTSLQVDSCCWAPCRHVLLMKEDVPYRRSGAHGAMTLTCLHQQESLPPSGSTVSSVHPQTETIQSCNRTTKSKYKSATIVLQQCKYKLPPPCSDPSLIDSLIPLCDRFDKGATRHHYCSSRVCCQSLLLAEGICAKCPLHCSCHVQVHLFHPCAG
jgi:hypothetical protein